MPIFIMAVCALLIFLAMGLLLFSATFLERRDRKRKAATGAATPGQPAENSKSRAAHA